MEQPTTAVTTTIKPAQCLVHIFPAIMRMICYFLNGFDIMALSHTNSRLLIQRLSVCVREFRVLKDDPTPQWNSSFWGVLPACIPLIKVYIMNEHLSVWNYGPSLLSHWPKTLQEIYFRMPCYFGDFLLTGSLARQLKKQPRKFGQMDIILPWQRIPKWNLKSMFPNLQIFSAYKSNIPFTFTQEFGAKYRARALELFFRASPDSLKVISLNEPISLELKFHPSLTCLRSVCSERLPGIEHVQPNLAETSSSRTPEFKSFRGNRCVWPTISS